MTGADLATARAARGTRVGRAQRAGEAPPLGVRDRWALPAMLLLAAANFLWQLGSSSYFVDEIQSLDVAAQPLSGVWHAAGLTEVTPPLYFYFAHEWLGRIGSMSPWVTRLPSALAGVALVAAVWWLARLLSDRPEVALIAAALTAISPFVLEYAQLAQGYVFEMLATTLAVACALRAERARHRRGAWLAAAGAAAVAALWLHYTAALLIVALCLWTLTRPAFPWSWRLGFLGACGVAEITLIPLLVAQHRVFPGRPGVARAAALTAASAERVLEAPFDGRVDPLRLLGVAVVAAALVLLRFDRGHVLRERGLVAGCAVGPLFVLIGLSALEGRRFLGHLMLARYAAPAAPVLLVVVAAATVSGPRPRAVGAVIGIAAVTVSLAGLLASHRPSGFNLDASGVARYIDARERPGDIVLAGRAYGEVIPLQATGLRPLPLGEPATTRLVLARRHRLWVIGQLSSNSISDSLLRRALTLSGYRALDPRVFPSVAPLGVVLEVPERALPR